MANKTMHHVVIGSDTFEIVDQYAREHSVTDTTLSISGSPADAKAVGDAVQDLDERIASISFDIIDDGHGNLTLVRSDMINTEEVNY